MDELLANYLHGLIPLKTFLKEIKSPLEIYEQLLSYKYQDDEIDKVMIVLLYLKMIKKVDSDKVSSCDYTTESLDFIDSIISDYEDELNQTLNVINESDESIIYQVGNIYIIINYLPKNNKINLPDNLKDHKYYCINCGDELTFKEFVRLYPYGFYLLEY